MKSKIGHKIGFAFLTLLVLIGIMTIITFNGFNTVTKSFNEMGQEAVKRGVSGNLRFSITQLLMTSNDYIITEKDYYKREFIRLNLKVDDYYNQFIQLNLTEEELQLSEEIKQCLDSIRAFSEKIFSIQHPRLSPNAWELMETMDYRFGEDVNIKTTQIFEGISNRIENLRIQAAADKERTAISIYIMFFSAIFISILVSYLTVQRISKPIISVTKAANGIANGDYSQIPKVKTHDEIAILAKSFNLMAESIQQSQKALEESKRLTEAIVATVPVGLLTYNSTGKILSVNNSFCNLFDLFQNLPLNQNISSLFNELTVTEACIDHILSCKSVQNVECCFLNAKKEIRIFNLTILPLQQTDGENLLMLEDITEHKRADEELRHAEKKYRSIFENAIEGIFQTTLDGRYISANPALARIYGYESAEELMKLVNDLKEQFYVEPDQRDEFMQHIENQGTVSNFESQVYRKDGSVIWISENARGVRDANGRLIGYEGTTMDITERKRIEEENSLLLTLTKSITEAGDFDSALAVALRMVSESTGWDFGEVWTPSRDGSYLECSPSWHSSFGNTQSFRRASEAFRFQAGIGLPGRVWSSQKPVWIPDVTVDPNFPRAPFAKEVGLRAGVGIPILDDKDVVAVMVFFLRNVRQEDERMIAIISAVAAQLGTLFRRKHAEQDIISQKNRFAQLFENSPVAIALLDDQDKILQINESFTALFGFYLEEIKAKTLLDLIVPQELMEEAKQFSNQTSKGDQLNKESYRKKKDGTLVYVQIVGIPVIENDKIVGIYGMYVDLTKQKETEENMRIAKELAEQSNKLKDTFISNISHEIRTPLNAILGYSGLIRDTFSQYASKDDLDYFHFVSEAGSRLMRTVEMILNISRLYISDFPIHPQQINLSSLIIKLVNEYKLDAERKSLELTFENRCGDVVLIADEYSITQAISNLIDNALKYTKQGFVKLLLYTNEKNELLLDVADSGIGISEDYIKKIFEPYSQEEIGYSRSYEGIGLGLSIVQKFLALNEADISVQSTKGKGSTFTINFSRKDAFTKVEQPYHRTKNIRRVDTVVDGAYNIQIQARKIDNQKKSQRKILPLEENKARKPNILLVEDDELNQRFIQTSLKNNYNTIIVSSACEALENLKVNPIELILMDISLKGELNGLELTKKIKATREYSKIPIIAVTAHAFEHDRQNALAAGCNNYISKPFNVNELLESMSELIKNR